MIYNYEHFGSIREMLETLDGRPQNPGMKDCKSSHREMSRRFSDSKTWDDALELYHGGKAAPREAMKAIKAEIDGTETRRKLERAYAGSQVNVARAIAGLPKDMYRRRAVQAPARKVRLVYNPSVACAVSAKDMERAGTAVFRAAYGLSRAGYHVEIVVAAISVACSAERDEVDHNKFGGVYRPKVEARGAYVTVKRYNELFNPAKLSFALCSPSMLRRFGFLWLERAPVDCRQYKTELFDYSSGYGSPIKYNPAGVESLKTLKLWDENTRYFNAYDVLLRDCDAERVIHELID